MKDVLGSNNLEAYAIINAFVVNTAIALGEVFFLSSIRCDQVSHFPQVPEIALNDWQPIFIHILYGAVTALLIVAWLYVGYFFTGNYGYFFLNLDKYKWWEVVAMIVAFMSLVEIRK